MARVRRILYGTAALAIVVTVALAVTSSGMEFASWVGAVIAALAIASSLVMRVFGTDSGSSSDAAGDFIEQVRVRGRRVIGKTGVQKGSGDRIRQRRVNADEDVIGKRVVDSEGSEES